MEFDGRRMPKEKSCNRIRTLDQPNSNQENAFQEGIAMTANRREFMLGSASLLLTMSCLDSAAQKPGLVGMNAALWQGDGKPNRFANYNGATLIGLGDERPSFLDQYGQLGGRDVQVLLDVDYPVRPFQNDALVPDAEWAQWLENGYLPIVRSKVNRHGVSVDWTAFTSDYNGLKSDYILIDSGGSSLHLRLLFTNAASVRLEGDRIISGDQVCAIVPGATVGRTTSAKYNLLSPESWCTDLPRWDPPVPLIEHSGLAKAFNSSRAIYMNRSIKYRIPVSASHTYHVYLGLITNDKKLPGESILKLTVNDRSQLLDLGTLGQGNPSILEFEVAPQGGTIHVASECDASSMSMSRDCFINAVWVFDAAVDRNELKTGSLDRRALVHIPCGREPAADVAATVDIEYAPGNSSGRHLLLPYNLSKSDAERATEFSISDAEAAVRNHWETFLSRGAQFKVGVPRLDNLYRTCLLNILLMRTKYSGEANDGQDLYVVKPGAGIYDNFWIRDGSYIANALGLAGYPEEVEKSLRLFWQPGLKGQFATWGQQPAGYWQSPITQWDSNGEALWALVHHFQLTQDKQWLRTAYDSIRKGALWIRYACEQMKFTLEQGERPVYYGLLPPGEGEAIVSGINYYHNFWALLGLHQATIAAVALGKTEDAQTFRAAYDDLRTNLLASVEWAYQHTGKGKFIPATPFDTDVSIWGSAGALYPCGFLEPLDPMMTATLRTMDTFLAEGAYIYKNNQVWTYITAEIAMCHLLRNETERFYQLFNSYVDYSSPTNAWVEGIMVKDRRGTGDMPHGWAAAEYIFLHRNSLVFENKDVLELCWGVQPAWLPEGAALSAKNAPTRFGKVDIELSRKGSHLIATYRLDSRGFTIPSKVALHIPEMQGAVTAVSVNSTLYPLQQGQTVIAIG
jgi:hypothetical protein